MDLKKFSRKNAHNLFFYPDSPIRGVVRKIYFCFSFGFLLARTTAVSLYAASVHDESRLPAPILYSVSGSSYSNEVCHVVLTINFDMIIFIMIVLFFFHLRIESRMV